MSSATSPVRDALEGYVAGRVQAARLVEAVATAYHGARGPGTGDWLKPLVDVIERAHPGVVELSASGDRPGFAVRLAERPFPKTYEAEFRRVVEQTLTSAAAGVDRGPLTPGPGPRFWSRLYSTIRTFFTASA
jgi:hypothetical protein